MLNTGAVSRPMLKISAIRPLLLSLKSVVLELATYVLRVDTQPDVFERITLHPRIFAPMRTIVSLRVPAQIRAAPLLFIHIPKNAGTSFCRLLYTLEPGHVSIRYYQMLAPELLRDSCTFAVLRNPVDRFMSSYNFTLNRGGEDVIMWQRPLKRLKHVKSIDDYLDYLETWRSDWLKVDHSGRPQWWFLVDVNGRIRVKHLFLLQEHAEQLRAFLAAHTDGPLTHANKTARREYTLTTDQLARIRKIYSYDFDLYETLKNDPDRSGSLNGSMITDLASTAGVG